MSIPKVNLHRNGPSVSKIIHGMWRLREWGYNENQLLTLIEQSIDHGITTFDHADIYGDYTCEEEFGHLLKNNPSIRQKIEIITKCGIKLKSEKRPEHKIKSYDTSPGHIIKSVENSLMNFNTDYVDILLIHRPDPFMDFEGTASAFKKLKDEGKVKYFGVSNFLPYQFDTLQASLDFPLVTNQIEFSVLHTDPLYDGTVAKCMERKISPTAWSPLGGGKLFSHCGEKCERVRETLNSLGKRYGANIDQIALSWITAHPADIISVIGTGNSERVKRSVEALEINLTREEWFEVLQASGGEEVP